MKSEYPYGAMAAWCVGFLLLAPCLWAQEAAAPKHVGVPQDWSEHNVVFSFDGLARHPDLIYREPRVRHQVMQRFPAPNSNFFRVVDGGTDSAGNSAHDRDWSVNLVRGRVAANMFPAKFSFNPGAPPSCQNDYVVFGLNVAGATGKQANLVAFNNLYAGTGGLCGAAPTVMFAYNVTTAKGGYVSLSPVISEDGTKIAFVETLSGSAVFHVLTWAAGQGAITKSAAPAAMTSLTFSTSARSTTSSPWVDYTNDIAYVGDDKGLVYKITGVFHGTPALSGAPWPVTISNGRLSPPVLDSERGLLMVGSRSGTLYQVNIANGALATLVVGKNGSIVAPPIVDVTNGTTFVVSANDGTSAVLVEADTATLTQLAKARIGLGAAGGTEFSILQPAFSNSYYTDPPDGVIRLCGTGASDRTPWQYAFGFTGRTMNTTAVFSQQLLTSTTATCTDWTEFYNPNINGGTDFFFFGLTEDCTGSGTSGCVVAATTETAPLTIAPVSGGPSGIVIDNYSTAGQASSIYLTDEGAGVSTAYKFTQNGLQ